MLEAESMIATHLRQTYQRDIHTLEIRPYSHGHLATYSVDQRAPGAKRPERVFRVAFFSRRAGDPGFTCEWDQVCAAYDPTALRGVK